MNFGLSYKIHLAFMLCCLRKVEFLSQMLFCLPFSFYSSLIKDLTVLLSKTVSSWPAFILPPLSLSLNLYYTHTHSGSALIVLTHIYVSLFRGYCWVGVTSWQQTPLVKSALCLSIISPFHIPVIPHGPALPPHPTSEPNHSYHCNALSNLQHMLILEVK